MEKFLGDMEANIKAVTPRFVCVHVQSVLIKVAKVVGLRVDGPFFGNQFWFELHCGHALLLCWVQVFKNSFEAFKRGGKGLLAMFSLATWPNPSGCVEHHDWPWPRFAASPREFGEAMGYALGCEGLIFASTVELVCVPFEKGFKLRYTLED